MKNLKLSENHPLKEYISKIDDYEGAFFYRFIELLVRYKITIGFKKKPLIILDYENIRLNPQIITQIAHDYYKFIK